METQLIDSKDISYITLKDGRRIEVNDVEIIPKTIIQESNQETRYLPTYPPQPNLSSSFVQNQNEIIPYETKQSYIYESPQLNQFSQNTYAFRTISNGTPSNYSFYISKPEGQFTCPYQNPLRNSNYYPNMTNTINYSRKPISTTYVRMPTQSFRSNSSNNYPRNSQVYYPKSGKITHGNHDNYKYVEIKGYGKTSTARKSKKKSQIFNNSNNNNYSNYKLTKSYGSTRFSGRNSNYSTYRSNRYSLASSGNSGIEGSNVWRGSGMRKRKTRKYI